jgi:hypothetical protein
MSNQYGDRFAWLNSALILDPFCHQRAGTNNICSRLKGTTYETGSLANLIRCSLLNEKFMTYSMSDARDSSD